MFVYVVTGLLVFCIAGSILTWLLYVPLVMRFFESPPPLLAESARPSLAGEECQFNTADGLVLRGTYFSAATKSNSGHVPHRDDEPDDDAQTQEDLQTSDDAQPRGVVLFCHEVNGDRWGALRYTEGLLANGVDVMTFDFRNQGQSEHLDGYRPMPWVTNFDVLDVQSAVEYLFGRNIGLASLGLMGVSKGASAALCAAALDPRIRAVATDGAFPIDGMQRYYIRRFANCTRLAVFIRAIPDACLMSFCKWCKFLVGLRRNCRFVNVDSIVRKIRQPVFMIHSELDSYVPLAVVQELRAAIGGRTRLWIVPKAKHNSAVKVAPAEYHRRVARFFRARLATSEVRETGSTPSELRLSQTVPPVQLV